MSEHTLGPWKAFSLNGIISVMKGGKEVVHWSGFDAADFKRQREANARLIAAAPVLLAALKAIAVAVDGVELIVRQQYPAMADSLRIRVSDAKAAITKAEQPGTPT